GLVEGVIADQVILAVRQCKQGVALTGREDRATGHVSVIRAKVLVEGFPTYTELTSQLGFRFPEAQLPDCDGLFVGQGLLASPVSSTLLGQDAFFGGLHLYRNFEIPIHRAASLHTLNNHALQLQVPIQSTAVSSH
ncbi:Uncharacterized protein ALO71_04840, partial [Pseudomonas amygdali pv. dendropanacis]